MRKDWEYKKLGEVANVVMGQSPDGSNVNNENGMEFHQGKINFGEQFLMKSDCFTTQVTKVAEKGSILLCVRAPIGIINITDRDICIGRGLCAIKEKTEVDNLFLYYYLLNKKLYFEKNSTGSTFKAISSKVVLNTPIFLPPKPTQLAIVAELDKLNEMIRLKKQQLEDYDQLAQSIFYEMFGDPVENEKGWEVKNIESVCSSIVRGPFGSALKKDYFVPQNSSTYKIYEQKNAIQKNASIGSYFITEEKFKELSRFELLPGDIIMSCSGTIGELYRIPMNAEKGIMNQALLKFSLLKQINFLYFLYVMDYVKKEFTIRGTGLQNIGSVKIIKSMKFGLPPLPLQQQFAARIEAIEQQKQQVKDTIKDLETLLASRMQYWFD